MAAALRRRTSADRFLRLALAVAMAGIAVSANADDLPTDAAGYDALIDDVDREHWAFQRVVRPEVPEVNDTAWPRNEIDHFILAELEGRGWKPAPPALPAALLRRLYLDLIGLPPTLAEQEAFLVDPSTAAVEGVIDDLLSRPGYGERWARHWLDLVRCAETNGYERDAIKPNAWRYRDYVIDSLNADKPYDRFVLEQLAGDELDDADGETLIATGFYRLGPWDDEPADVAQDRFEQLDDMIRATSRAFLGLTLGCARCHTHKFEPFTHVDYYRMAAIFNGLTRPQNGRTELDLPAGSRAEIAAVAERDQKIAELQAEIDKRRAAFRSEFLAAGRSQLPADVVAACRMEPDKRDESQQKLAAEHEQQLADELAAAMPEELQAELAALDNNIAELMVEVPDLPRGYFMQEASPDPPPMHLHLRGQASQPAFEVGPGVPVVLAATQPEFIEPDEYTSRRRLSLARWVASPENPLTARVIVNRVWQHHFGEGIVRTPSDFGIMGEAPTHPELLDWLADWFVNEGGWSLKKLHRLILTSNTYLQSRQWNAEYGEADPENELRWHASHRRLEAEIIRDSMLAASGTLSRTMGGPSMYPSVPAGALEGHSDPDKIWQPLDVRAASRRTIYALVKRSMIVPMLEVLDFCDTTRSASQRDVTVTAPQALTLLNSEFVNRQARHFADRLTSEVGDEPAKQVERAFRLAVCRPPSESESADLTHFLESESQQIYDEAAARDEPIDMPTARHQALVQMCRVVLNLNEFVYVD